MNVKSLDVVDTRVMSAEAAESYNFIHERLDDGKGRRPGLMRCRPHYLKLLTKRAKYKLS